MHLVLRIHKPLAPTIVGMLFCLERVDWRVLYALKEKLSHCLFEEFGTMDELEIVALFDSEETARDVSKAFNQWVNWVLDGDPDDAPDLFEDFGVSTDEYALEASDVDWPEPPRARPRGSKVVVGMEGGETVDTVQELLEALGAFDVYEAGDDDDDD